MKLLESIKILFYLIILLLAFAALRFMEGIGTEASEVNTVVLWQDDFDSLELRKPLWHCFVEDRLEIEDGLCRIDTSEFLMLLNLPLVQEDFPSDVDSGFIEIRVKLPHVYKSEFFVINTMKDTSVIQIPTGLHSDFIKLRSEGLSLKTMGPLVIKGSPMKKKFDIVDAALNIIEDDGVTLDYVKLYGIRQ